MHTQEVEGYLERIQYQNKILDDWEQSRKQFKRNQSQSQSQTCHSQSLKQQRATPTKPAVNGNVGVNNSRQQKPGTISAMGKLMKNWITTGGGLSSSSQQQQSQQDRKPAARSLSIMIDSEVEEKRRDHRDDEAKGQNDDENDGDDDDDDESQTQMPPSGFMDSPDLLALSNGYAMSHLSAFNRTGVIGRAGGSRVVNENGGGGLEEVVSQSTFKKPVANRKPTARQVIAASPPRRSAAASGSRKRAVTAVAVPSSQSSQLGGDEDEEIKESSAIPGRGGDDDSEVGDSQAPFASASRTQFDQYSRSSAVLKVSNSAHADLLQRRKKQRVSEDFEGAITAYRSQQHKQQQQQNLPVSVQPVARLASLKSPSRGILNGGPSVLHGRCGVASAATAAPTPATTGARLLSPQPLSRPPLSSSARQLAAEIRMSNSFTLVATDLTNAECKRISTACSLLGGRFGLRFDLRPDPETGVLCSSVTHLIAKSVKPGERRCKRTAKYMRALAEGCFVMDYSWVEASLETGKWVREDEYEMLGDAYSDSVGKPHESHVQRVRTGRRNELFQRFRFVLLCDEAEFDYQIETLRGVVENFGATVISTTHYKRLGHDRRAQKTQVGIVGKSTAPTDAKEQWEQFQIPIVRVAWLFDCISHLEVLSYDEYYPY